MSLIAQESSSANNYNDWEEGIRTPHKGSISDGPGEKAEELFAPKVSPVSFYSWFFSLSLDPSPSIGKEIH